MSTSPEPAAIESHRLRAIDYVTMNLYYFGLSFLWNALGRFLLQAMLPQPHMAGTDNAEAALGLLGFVGLLIATIVQPVAGAISDGFGSRWGRRRPFMVVWTLVDLIFLAGIAFAPNYWLLLVMYCLLQFSSNFAHGPYQGLLPDLVPEARHGVASSIKQFIDTAGLIAVALVIPLLFANPASVSSNVQTALALIAFVLVGTMFLNVVLVREAPSQSSSVRSVPRVDFGAIGRFAGDVRQFTRDYSAFAWLVASRLAVLGALVLLSNYAQFYYQKVIFADIPDLDQSIKAAVNLQGQLLQTIVVLLLVVTLFAGPVSDRIGRRPVVAVGGILAAIGAFSLLFVRNAPLLQLSQFSLTDLVMAGILIGVGMGLFTSANWAWAVDLTPPTQAARFLGLTNVATAGATVVTSLFGPVISVLNARVPGSGFTFMFVAATLGFLVGVLMLLKVRETRGRAVTRGASSLG